ncbi:MAG: hypothetical protein VW951_01765 [Gammaproteobacteria bacterium]
MISLDKFTIDNIPRNYLISSNNIHGRYEFVLNKICNFMKIPPDKIYNCPDIHYVSLPKTETNGKIISSVTNDDLILKSYGILDKDELKRIGNEITINQIREIISFTQVSAHKDKKIVLINNASSMNKEASSALLKTLEEVVSNCSFILLCNSGHEVQETIRSRCQHLDIDDNLSYEVNCSFQSFFFLKHSFLVNLKKEYDLENIIETIIQDFESLLSNKLDPLDASYNWSKHHINLLLIIIKEYLIFTSKKILLNNDIESRVKVLKKYSNLYKKIPTISNDLLMNINSKYLLNNLAIEIAA